MSDDSDDRIRTIREINGRIRTLVESEILPAWVKGIVRDYRPSNKGYAIFDLHDQDYLIRCLIPEEVLRALNLELREGLNIQVFGSVSVYPHQGRTQIRVERIQLGDNDTPFTENTALIELKNKGLWPKAQRPLPEVVNKIGIITSRNSNVRGDFEQSYKKRGGKASIEVIEVTIQGSQAPTEISLAINQLNHENRVDVIAVVRGGGSVIDLATFNDLLILETICKSSVPIVMGIGHSEDSTLADQVADFTTITPTETAYFLAEYNQTRTDPLSTRTPVVSNLTSAAIPIQHINGQQVSRSGSFNKAQLAIVSAIAIILVLLMIILVLISNRP